MRIATCVVLVLILPCAVRPATAEIVRFRMTGLISIEFVQGSLPEGVYEGAPFEVVLSYNAARPDFYPDDPQRGLYPTETGPDNFLVFRAGSTMVRAVDLWLWVGNDLDEGPTLDNGRPLWELPDDAFLMRTSSVTTNLPENVFESIAFRWHDPTRTALDSDELPTEIDPNAFQDVWFELTGGSSTHSAFAIRAIVSEVAKVPEPAAWQIGVASTLLFWVGASRGRRRVWQFHLS